MKEDESYTTDPIPNTIWLLGTNLPDVQNRGTEELGSFQLHESVHVGFSL